MATGELLYEGKAKKIFSTDNPDQVVQYFKDDATAFNAQKRGTIVEKGIINNKVSERLFRLLEHSGGATHFLAGERAIARCSRKGSPSFPWNWWSATSWLGAWRSGWASKKAKRSSRPSSSG